MKLTYALNNIKDSISKGRGYEAVRSMYQLAHSYNINIDELEELIELGTFKHSIQTLIHGGSEERMDALVKLVGGGESESERLNSLTKTELKHLFHLLVKALQEHLEYEFNQVIADIITRLKMLLEDYYQSVESEEQIEEIETLVSDLSEVSISNFEGLRSRFLDVIDLDDLYLNHGQVYEGIENAWDWMFNLKHCVNFLNSNIDYDCFLYVYD